jgi:hypothetical protein
MSQSVIGAPWSSAELKPTAHILIPYINSGRPVPNLSGSKFAHRTLSTKQHLSGGPITLGSSSAIMPGAARHESQNSVPRLVFLKSVSEIPRLALFMGSLSPFPVCAYLMWSGLV